MSLESQRPSIPSTDGYSAEVRYLDVLYLSISSCMSAPVSALHDTYLNLTLTFPVPMRFRYCYPKGDPDYSSRKGGALWTMYLDNGKEDLEYRLLHVYYSAKRAVNKGIEVPQGIESTPKRYSSPKKKQRRIKKTRHPRDDMPRLGSFAADSAESTVGSSPLSFQVPPPSPPKDPPSTETHGYGTSKFITPEKEGFSDNNNFHPIQFSDDVGRTVSVSMANPHPHNIRPKQSAPYQYAVGYSPGVHRLGTASNTTRSYPTQELRTPSQCRYPYQQQQQQDDPFPLEGGGNPFDMDSSSWPFTSPAATQGFPTPEARDTNDSSTEDNIKSFALNLETIHDSIKETIGRANESEQGHLVNVLCGWAKKVIQMPLGSTATSGGSAMDGDTDAGSSSAAHSAIREQYSFSASPNYSMTMAHHAQYTHQQQQQHQSHPGHYYNSMPHDNEAYAETDQKAAV